MCNNGHVKSNASEVVSSAIMMLFEFVNVVLSFCLDQKLEQVAQQ